MSEETRAALHRAEEELTSARDHARTIELELLHAIAAELPARAEELPGLVDVGRGRPRGRRLHRPPAQGMRTSQ